MSQKQATYYGLAAVLCWSTVATAFKLSLVHLSPTQLILLASLSSWVFLSLILTAQGKLSQLFSQSKGTYLSSLLYGLLNPTLYYLLLFTAYDLLPAQEAQAINYSWAIVMSFLAVPLLKQKLTPIDMLAALVCYLGVLVIATRGNVVGLEFANMQGVLFAVISTVVWSLYWILNRRDNRDALLGLFLNFSFAVPLIAAYAWWSGELSGLFGANASVHWHGWVGGVYVGLFEMGLAFVLWLQAMRKAENTSKIANLIFISPFLSLALIATFLDEPILSSTIVGLVLILAGLVFQQRFTAKKA